MPSLQQNGALNPLSAVMHVYMSFKKHLQTQVLFSLRLARRLFFGGLPLLFLRRPFLFFELEYDLVVRIEQ